MANATITPQEAQDALRDILIMGAHDSMATKYLSGVGLVLVLYDHLLTFNEEIRLVWKAKHSFAKHAFILNRYIVACSLVTVAYFLNHYEGPPLSTIRFDNTVTSLSCKRFLGTMALLGITSVGFANILVLLRVVSLWERNVKIMILMTIGFCLSFSATFSLMVVCLTKLLPSVTYNEIFSMCVTTKKTGILPAVWASPMLFEVFVLTSVCWNAIDRPRAKTTALMRVLHRDGIVFLSSLTVLRTFNLVMAAVARPTLVLVGVFFVWSMTTVILNRSLLNILRAASVRRGNSDDPYTAFSNSNAGRSHSIATTMSIVVGNDDLVDYEEYNREFVSSPDQFGSRSHTWGIELGERNSKKSKSTKD